MAASEYSNDRSITAVLNVAIKIEGMRCRNWSLGFRANGPERILEASSV